SAKRSGAKATETKAAETKATGTKATGTKATGTKATAAKASGAKASVAKHAGGSDGGGTDGETITAPGGLTRAGSLHRGLTRRRPGQNMASFAVGDPPVPVPRVPADVVSDAASRPPSPSLPAWPPAGNAAIPAPPSRGDLTRRVPGTHLASSLRSGPPAQ